MTTERHGTSVSRRTILKTSGATALGGFAGSILASAGMMPVGNAVFAQDATPDAGTALQIRRLPIAVYW